MKNSSAPATTPDDAQAGGLLERTNISMTIASDVTTSEKQVQTSLCVDTTDRDSSLSKTVTVKPDIATTDPRERHSASPKHDSRRIHTVESMKMGDHASDATTSPTVAGTTSAIALDNSASKKAPPTSIVDIAFEEDTRLFGLHPANLDAEQSAKLDEMMPIGYRYARELQQDLVFIPPLNHPQVPPGSQFVLQKGGTHAVPIIRPPL